MKPCWSILRKTRYGLRAAQQQFIGFIELLGFVELLGLLEFIESTLVRGWRSALLEVGGKFSCHDVTSP